jgi:excisionase family DNA binding protein
MQTDNQPVKLAYSIKEAVAVTSISRSTLYLMISDGTIETRKIGKRTLIPAASLQRLIKGEA